MWHGRSITAVFKRESLFECIVKHSINSKQIRAPKREACTVCVKTCKFPTTSQLTKKSFSIAMQDTLWFQQHPLLDRFKDHGKCRANVRTCRSKINEHFGGYFPHLLPDRFGERVADVVVDKLREVDEERVDGRVGALALSARGGGDGRGQGQAHLRMLSERGLPDTEHFFLKKTHI